MTTRIELRPSFTVYDDDGNAYTVTVTQEVSEETAIGGQIFTFPGTIRNYLADGTPIAPADGYYWSPDRERRFSLAPQSR